MSISICMATYNGMDYLPEQISSIMVQLNDGDELIIVDDASTDGTVSYIRSIKDPRISIYQNEKNLGHVQTFARALNIARGEFIFLADQDDVWLEDRVSSMCRILAEGALLVTTNSAFMDKNGAPIKPMHRGVFSINSKKYFKNIINIFAGKAFYYGCAMAMRRELLDVVLPIPKYVESHDLFIAMAANCGRSNVHLEINTLIRRIHGGNASVVTRSIRKIIKSRLIFFLSLINLIIRFLK